MKAEKIAVAVEVPQGESCGGCRYLLVSGDCLVFERRVGRESPRRLDECRVAGWIYQQEEAEQEVPRGRIN